jgi:hypothetical protein
LNLLRERYDIESLIDDESILKTAGDYLLTGCTHVRLPSGRRHAGHFKSTPEVIFPALSTELRADASKAHSLSLLLLTSADVQNTSNVKTGKRLLFNGRRLPFNVKRLPFNVKRLPFNGARL